MRLARTLYMLVWKDFLLDYRNPLNLTVLGVFSLAAGVAVGLVYRSSLWPAPSLISAALPLGMVFLAIYTVHASFLREADAGTLDGLRLTPLDPGLLMVSKALYSTLLILASSLLLTLSALFFSGVPQVYLGGLVAWLGASSLFLGAVASLASSMLVYSGARGSLAPALLLVFFAPFINTAAPSLVDVLAGHSPSPGSFLGLLGLGLGFLALGVGLSRFLVE